MVGDMQGTAVAGWSLRPDQLRHRDEGAGSGAPLVHVQHIQASGGAFAACHEQHADVGLGSVLSMSLQGVTV